MLELFSNLILGQPLDEQSRLLLADYVEHGTIGDRQTQTRLRDAIALLLASPAFQWS